VAPRFRQRSMMGEMFDPGSSVLFDRFSDLGGYSSLVAAGRRLGAMDVALARSSATRHGLVQDAAAADGSAWRRCQLHRCAYRGHRPVFVLGAASHLGIAST
jgi:hypothetical protein